MNLECIIVTNVYKWNDSFSSVAAIINNNKEITKEYQGYWDSKKENSTVHWWYIGYTLVTVDERCLKMWALCALLSAVHVCALCSILLRYCN